MTEYREPLMTLLKTGSRWHQWRRSPNPHFLYPLNFLFYLEPIFDFSKTVRLINYVHVKCTTEPGIESLFTASTTQRKRSDTVKRIQISSFCFFFPSIKSVFFGFPESNHLHFPVAIRRGSTWVCFFSKRKWESCVNANGKQTTTEDIVWTSVADSLTFLLLFRLQNDPQDVREAHSHKTLVKCHSGVINLPSPSINVIKRRLWIIQVSFNLALAGS